MSDMHSRSFMSYAWRVEQALVYFTFSVLGASVGLLEGSFKGFQTLQPSFRSTEGIQALIYGSDHKGERDQHSISDLLFSWIPVYKKHEQPSPKRECFDVLATATQDLFVNK